VRDLIEDKDMDVHRWDLGPTPEESFSRLKNTLAALTPGLDGPDPGMAKNHRSNRWSYNR